MDENGKNQIEPLASEMYADLKRTDKFKNRLIFVLIGIIVLLASYIAAQSIYHDYQWSQFDTYVLDGGEGGNANFVHGDNTGGIYNGASDSTGPQENQQD